MEQAPQRAGRSPVSTDTLPAVSASLTFPSPTGPTDSTSVLLCLLCTPMHHAHKAGRTFSLTVIIFSYFLEERYPPGLRAAPMEYTNKNHKHVHLAPRNVPVAPALQETEAEGSFLQVHCKPGQHAETLPTPPQTPVPLKKKSEKLEKDSFTQGWGFINILVTRKKKCAEKIFPLSILLDHCYG